MSIKIGSREIGGEDLFFIAEEGQANLGDFNKAIAMIDAIAKTGADAVEFQLARAGDFYVREAKGYQIYAEREFTDIEIEKLVSRAKSQGLEFIAAPLSHKLVGVLAKMGCSGFNINASDLTNPDIIDTVVNTGLPFFLSLPLAEEKEIDWAVNRIKTMGNSNYCLLHGQHTMASGESGVSVEHTILGYLAELKKKYKIPAGFIDHTPLIWMPAGAVAAGADIVSKHFTLSRGEKGPDWQVCLELDEMKQAIQWARDMRKSIKVDYKKLAPGEDIDKSKMRRSIVAARAIKQGEIIGREDILFKRPGTGMCPSRFEEIVGKKAIKDFQFDEQIKMN